MDVQATSSDIIIDIHAAAAAAAATHCY